MKTCFNIVITFHFKAVWIGWHIPITNNELYTFVITNNEHNNCHLVSTSRNFNYRRLQKWFWLGHESKKKTLNRNPFTAQFHLSTVSLCSQLSWGVFCFLSPPPPLPPPPPLRKPIHINYFKQSKHAVTQEFLPTKRLNYKWKSIHINVVVNVNKHSLKTRLSYNNSFFFQILCKSFFFKKNYSTNLCIQIRKKKQQKLQTMYP